MMIAILLSTLMVSAWAAPDGFYAGYPYHPLGYYAHPYIGGSQYRSQDALGQYNYGYATANGIRKSESGGIDGQVAGSYSYTSPDGKQVDISYTAGKDGFQATGDAIPKAVEPTAEVAEAAMKHSAAKAEAESKAAAAPEVEAADLGYYNPHPLAYGYNPYVAPNNHFGYGFAY